MWTANHHQTGPRALIVLGAAIALGTAIPGCARLAADDNRVTIRFSFWGRVQEARVWQDLARRFERKHPGIHIKLEHITGVNYHYKVLAMTVGGCAPDVLSCDDEQFAQLASNGLYEDLTPYIRRDFGPKMAELYPAFRDAWQVDGRFRAISFLGNCLLIYYNREQRRQAGLSPDPNPNWDWKEFDHDAVALTRDLDHDGHPDQFGLGRLSWFYCMQWIWAAGGTDMDPGMTRYMFDTPAGRRGFQFVYDQMHKLKVTPLMGDLPNMTTEAQFFTGKISMVVAGTWWMLQCRSSKNLDWDLAPMPIGPVKRSSRATSEALAISPQSRHKAECWEWIKFVLTDEGQRVLAQSGRGLPAVRRIALQTMPDPSTPQHEELFLDAMDHYVRRSLLHDHWMAAEQQILNPEWDRVIAGDINVDQFIKNVMPRVDEMLHGDDL